MPHILIASDKFRGSLSAAEVADALTRGVRRVRPAATVVPMPVADGGEGTLAAAVAAGYGLVRVRATGPTGRPVTSGYARDGARAVVELADVSGLSRLPENQSAPLTATSRGAGEVIAAAIADGCEQIVLGIGGSACTDGGAGLVRALGARLLDSAGREIEEGGAALDELAGIDLGPLRPRVDRVEFTVACDVTNPLTGPNGAAAAYGPQKGASATDVKLLDRALGHWADVVAATTGADRRAEPGAGAAGGVGFAALSLLGATLRPGIELVLELIGFTERLAGAALVVTGEGALDAQTLHGKAPLGVARAARAAGVPVVAVCGRTTLTPSELTTAGFSHTYCLTDLEPDVQRCISDAAALLEELGARLAADELVG